MHDLVIRGGMIFDGTGRERFAGDVAIDSGVLTQVLHGICITGFRGVPAPFQGTRTGP